MTINNEGKLCFPWNKKKETKIKNENKEKKW